MPISPGLMAPCYRREMTEQSSAIAQAENWDGVYAEVNAWRGACMHHFSAVETAVTETLLALSGLSSARTQVRLRHLIGQRFEDLAAAIGPEGPFAKAGKAAHSELALYRSRHETFRTVLCHGVVQVTLTAGGDWVLIIRSLTIRGKQAEKNAIVLAQAEAQAKLAALKHNGTRLTSLLGQLRKDSDLIS
jgi:hypothetical protein